RPDALSLAPMRVCSPLSLSVFVLPRPPRSSLFPYTTLFRADDWQRSAGPWARGSVLGFIIGILPGVGPSLASFMSYIMEKRISKRKEEFGHGAIEGVAGPEAEQRDHRAAHTCIARRLGTAAD